jgi:hypothetical protein
VNLTDKDIARFWTHVAKTETCWLWTACCRWGKGYGAFRLRDKAHATLSGIDTTDSDAWVSDPKGLRIYNCSDSFMTFWLCEQLKVYGGVK